VIRLVPFFLAAVALAVLVPAAGAQQGQKSKKDQPSPPGGQTLASGAAGSPGPSTRSRHFSQTPSEQSSTNS
jgi:hypothetical protein